jgi:RNA polymerase sigma-70 factor (ECF subfamily)
MPEHPSAVLTDLLEGCLKGDRRCQEQLYKQFYSYALGVCLRYTQNKEEAKEVMNDGFLKIFTKLDTYDRARPFKTWLTRVMINTALDFYRSEAKHRHVYEDVEAAKNYSVDATALSQLSYLELVELVQRLSPAYRTVFSLAVMDGYSHEEIAEELGISIGTSKSNLARARENLKVMISGKRLDEYDGVIR